MRARLAFKRAAQILVLLVIIFGAAELIAAYMLFRYGALKQAAFQPTGLASVYLVEKALRIPAFHPVASVDPSPLYVPDERLGYVSTPARHRVSNSLGRKTFSFFITVLRAGERATSYEDLSRPHSIYVFGDSFIHGLGNFVEHTMP